MTERRIFACMSRAHLDLMFTPEAQRRLAALGTLEGANDAAVVEPPPELGNDYDAVITSWSTGRDHPERFVGSRLGLLVHSTGSIRGIVPRTLLEQGVRVAQGGVSPMARAVAECATGLTLMLLRHLHLYDRQLQSSRDWVASRTPDHGLSVPGRKFGIVSLSRVGWHNVDMIKGLGATVIRAYDPYADPERAREQGVELVGLDELFSSSDVLVVHAPTTDETKGMIGKEQLALLADDSVLINTARSVVIETEALLAELTSGRLRAGLDVFDVEPLPADSPFYGLPNVIVLPHIAGATIDDRYDQGDVVVAELERFFAGEPLVHEVTLDAYDQLA